MLAIFAGILTSFSVVMLVACCMAASEADESAEEIVYEKRR